MAVGVGGAGAMGIALETVMGTYVAPTTWVPILSDGLNYTEDRYISPAIRGKTIASLVKQGFYHAEGDIDWEVDTALLPYFLYCMRLTIVKTGAGPYNYSATLASGASSGIGGANATQKTMSITMIRNGKVFKYVGCVVPSYNFRVEDGVLKSNMTVMGLGETGVNADTAPSQTFAARKMLGADAHTVSVDAAGISPAFATPANDFNGFTFSINDNGAAQNRIRPNRQASYISFGETEATLATQLDFQDRSEMDNFIATTGKAIKLVSVNAAASDRVQLIAYNAIYTTYGVQLTSIGDIVMADTELRMIDFTGGTPFGIIVDSTTSIT